VQVSLTARNRRALRRALARGGRKVTARITLRATGTGGAPRHRTVLVRLRR
jgi:hypothetical protein